jgi:hypothetical protein
MGAHALQYLKVLRKVSFDHVDNIARPAAEHDLDSRPHANSGIDHLFE